MTIAELIKQLQDYDDRHQVFIEIKDDFDDKPYLLEINKVDTNEGRVVILPFD